MRQTVTVEFTCYSCDVVNRQSVQISTDHDLSSLNLRKRTVELECSNCGKRNSVDVYL